MTKTKFEVPTIFVIFGATGDLMEKKLVPALFRLYVHNHMPEKFQILAISRREMADAEFATHLTTILSKSSEKDASGEKIQQFTSMFQYVAGDFTTADLYGKLAEKLGSIDNTWSTCSNKLYYLAVPPAHYEEIITNLAKRNLHTPCSDTEGYTRIIVEKPFGHDLLSAQKLNQLLTSYFKEEQIYRLDHYLGKRILQNIMAFRFSNNLFDGAWSNKYIEKVEIKILETQDVSTRGSFYDTVGALRDVGQNHLLEFLAMVAMENPEKLDALSVRRARTQLLTTIRTPEVASLNKTSYRAQYDGYLQEKGVDPHSQTETYFKVELELNHPLWRGVPFILEAGKALQTEKKEVVITFKKHMPSLSTSEEAEKSRNKMFFKMAPEESIQLDLLAKKEGYEMLVEQKRFLLNERAGAQRSEYTEEYEKLLLDAFLGDQTFFVANSEIVEMWRIVDPIVGAWAKNSVPFNHYPKGTDTIRTLAKEWVDKSLVKSDLAREVGIIGLGKMGGGLAQNFLNHGWKVIGYNRSKESTEALASHGLTPSYSLAEFVSLFSAPRVILLSLPHGEATTQTIEELSHLLNTGDIVIDGGNSPYKDAAKHEQLLREKNIEFMDVGISGGPGEALTGPCLIVGGKQRVFEHLQSMFTEIGYPGGVAHFEGTGAGHFVKMVHNAIEYGMMQSLAEGFNMLHASEFGVDLSLAADIYSHGSVIESRLVSWLAAAFETYGAELKGVKGSVDALGEGGWAVDYAEDKALVDWAIKASVDFRTQSQQNPSFTGQILSAIRGQFGGHPVAETHE